GSPESRHRAPDAQRIDTGAGEVLPAGVARDRLEVGYAAHRVAADAHGVPSRGAPRLPHLHLLTRRQHSRWRRRRSMPPGTASGDERRQSDDAGPLHFPTRISAPATIATTP